MARLPTLDSLGSRPGFGGQRSIASVRNAGAVGDAITQVGQVAGQIVDQHLEQQDRLDLGVAQAEAMKVDQAARDALKDDQDFATFDQRYRATASAGIGAAAGRIRNTSLRARFEQAANAQIEQGAAAVGELARTRRHESERATGNEGLSALQRTFVETDSPLEQAAAITGGQNIIAGLLASGAIGADDAERLGREWTESARANRVVSLLAKGRPDDAARALEQYRAVMDPVQVARFDAAITERTRAVTAEAIADAEAAGRRDGGAPLPAAGQPAGDTAHPAGSAANPTAARSYANVPFSAVKDRIAGQEAPDSLGGYSAIAYNTSQATNSAGVPQVNLTAMTLGQVNDFQINTMRPITRGRRGGQDVGSTGVGRYQFESRTLAENAQIAFGANWRNVVFTPENQDKLAATLWGRVRDKPELLRNTWAAFNEGGGGVDFAGRTTPAPLDPRQTPLSTRLERADALLLQRKPDATLEDREAVRTAVTRRFQVDHMDVAADQDRTNADMRVGVSRGTISQQDVDTARATGQIGDGDWSALSLAIDERNKAQSALVNFNTMVNTPGFTFNPFDDNQKKAVEAGVAAAGGTPMAAFQVWQRTGILAEAGAVALRGGLVSTDPDRVQAVANIAGNMLLRNPNAFAGVPGGDEIERSALAFNHYLRDLGYAPEEAAKRVAQDNTPQMKERLRVAQPQLEEFRKTLRQGNVSAAEVFGSTRFMSPGVGQAATQAYVDLIVDNMQHGMDDRTARAAAGTQLKRIYGVTHGDPGDEAPDRVMAYPPERGYPAVNVGLGSDARPSHIYLYLDAAKSVKEATGHDVGPNDIWFKPIPGVTDQDFRSGTQPPRYRVMYRRVLPDGQTVFETLRQPWYGDVAAARAARQTDIEPQFRREAAQRPTQSLLEIQAANPRRSGEGIFQYQTRMETLRQQQEDARAARIEAAR